MSERIFTGWWMALFITVGYLAGWSVSFNDRGCSAELAQLQASRGEGVQHQYSCTDEYVPYSCIEWARPKPLTAQLETEDGTVREVEITVLGEIVMGEE